MQSHMLRAIRALNSLRARMAELGWPRNGSDANHWATAADSKLPEIARRSACVDTGYSGN
jgi:hypothetical protein